MYSEARATSGDSHLISRIRDWSSVIVYMNHPTPVLVCVNLLLPKVANQEVGHAQKGVAMLGGYKG